MKRDCGEWCCNGVAMDLRKTHSRVPRHKAISVRDAEQKARFFSNTAARIPALLMKAVYQMLN